MSPASYPTATTIEEFAANAQRVRARIDAAAERSGRSGEAVRLLAVSKTVPSERLRLAVAAGLGDLGENKVQEGLRKSQELADLEIAWSVIGHLQTNKARHVAQFAAEFQALDRPEVAEALDRRLQALGRSLDVFVQVNTSGEASKFGLAPEDVADFVAILPQYSALRCRGLMTLAALSEDRARVRGCFQLLRRVRDQVRETTPSGVAMDELSMGMSGDFELAVEEGATVVRVGQAIFGARLTPDSAYWPPGN
jgi:pyridoxal phosphate enzyme (YggS family)